MQVAPNIICCMQIPDPILPALLMLSNPQTNSFEEFPVGQLTWVSAATHDKRGQSSAWNEQALRFSLLFSASKVTLPKYHCVADCQKIFPQIQAAPPERNLSNVCNILLSKFTACCLIFTGDADSCQSNCGTSDEGRPNNKFWSWLTVLFWSA